MKLRFNIISQAFAFLNSHHISTLQGTHVGLLYITTTGGWMLVMDTHGMWLHSHCTRPPATAAAAPAICSALSVGSSFIHS